MTWRLTQHPGDRFILESSVVAVFTPDITVVTWYIGSSHKVLVFMT